MKKYIIASQICMFPFLLLGLSLPLAVFLKNPNQYNERFTIFCFVTLTLSVAIILGTLLMMGKYCNQIDRLDEAELQNHKEKLRLNSTIQHYNNLINSIKSNTDAAKQS